MTIRRLQRDNYHSVGIITDNESEELVFCENCQKNRGGQLSKLKERLYLDEKGKLIPPPPDADSYRQCWTCGYVVPLREVKKSGTITGIEGIEILQNPFDVGRGIITGTDDAKNRYQKLKQRKTRAKHHDKEVQRLIEDGFELKAYSQDIPVSNNNNNDNVY